jgi:hypothetical protein
MGSNVIRKSAGAFLLAVTLAVLALPQAAYAREASKYDGMWSLVVYTRSGPCDQSFRFSGQILNGVFSYGSIGVNLTGRVNSNGGAVARVSAGSSYAVAYGRLTAKRGGGTWRGRMSSGYCSGIWAATRT